jgi:RNA polymerase sigma-70 factor (ECF subfamily)
VTPDTEHVWERLHSNLRSFVGRRVRNTADVDDLVQRVFLHLHHALPTLRDEDRIHAWVYRTTRNAIADYYRAPVHRREVPAGSLVDVADSEAPAHGAHGGTEPTAMRELAGCLKPLFAALSPEDQAALRAIEFEGMTQVDAARRLGLSTSGMKSRVQRARKRLKASLEDCCRVELDRRGGITSFESRRRSAPCGPACSSDCKGDE